MEINVNFILFEELRKNRMAAELKLAS